MALRFLDVEICQIGPDKTDKEPRNQIKALCEAVQEATNFVWAEWFAWHRRNRSREAILHWTKLSKIWHEEYASSQWTWIVCEDSEAEQCIYSDKAQIGTGTIAAHGKLPN